MEARTSSQSKNSDGAVVNGAKDPVSRGSGASSSGMPTSGGTDPAVEKPKVLLEGDEVSGIRVDADVSPGQGGGLERKTSRGLMYLERP